MLLLVIFDGLKVIKISNLYSLLECYEMENLELRPTKLTGYKYMIDLSWPVTVYIFKYKNRLSYVFQTNYLPLHIVNRQPCLCMSSESTEKSELVQNTAED